MQYDDISSPDNPVYSLGGSGFNNFNVATIPQEERISDGLGHYWDSATQGWMNDSGGAYNPQQSYQQPQDDYFGNFDSYAPENLGTQQYEPPVDVPFAPESWSLPPEEPTDYNLNAPVSAFTGYGSPNAANPWDANNQQEQDAPWWQDAGNAIGDSFVNTAQTFGNVIAAPYVAAEDMFSDQTDTGFNERVGANFSGEKAQEMVGIDTSYMDWLRDQGPLGKTAAYGIDTLTAPATLLTAGLGPEAGAIGSAFGGNVAKRLAGETALGTVGYLGSDAATSDVADKIPYFSDQPDWLRSLEGGAIGGIGAYGGLKTVGKNLDEIGGVKGLLAGESGETPPLFPKGGSVDDTTLNPVRRKIADALDAEMKFRTSGEAEAIKAAKRAEQVGGIDAAQLGATGEETLANIRGGAKVGEFFDRTPGLKLPEEDFNAALKDIMDATGGFDKIKTVTALDKLQNGIRLQPKEIEALGELYGPEVAAKIRATNADRIVTKAAVPPDELQRIGRISDIADKRLAKLQAEAKAQRELADNLDESVRLNPTRKPLKTAAEDARARAIAKETAAEELSLKNQEAWAARQQKYADDAEAALAKEQDKAKAALNAKADEDWMRGLEDPASDSYAARMARQEDSANKSLSAAQDAAKKAQAERQARIELARLKEEGKVLKAQSDADLKNMELARKLREKQAQIAEKEDALRRAKITKDEEAYAEQIAKQEAKAEKQLAKDQDRALATAADTRNTKLYVESGQAAVAKAEEYIDSLDITPALKKSAKDMMATNLRSNGVALASYGDVGPTMIRRIYAAATGEVTDSYTSHLLALRENTKGALMQTGLSPEASKVIADHIMEAELKIRYGGSLPKHVQDSLDQAKGLARDADGKIIKGSASENNVVRGMGQVSAELKNMMFSLGDVAVLGQNFLHTGITNSTQILAGLTNRAASLIGHGIDVNTVGDSMLARRAAFALDGVKYSSSIGSAETGTGTILRHIPGLKTFDEKVLQKAIDKATDFQFGFLLGNARTLVHEGNLVLAKVAGEDITDTVVRQKVAKWTNSATGAGELAQRANRANVERAGFLTPSMTRAQAQQGSQVAQGTLKGIANTMQDVAHVATFGKVARNLDSGVRAERILAASTLLSTGTSLLVIGKLLNDRYGLEEFEFNPGKPGFGDITIPGGTTINLFSQFQLAKVMAKSVQTLIEDGATKDDMTKIARDWGNFGVGRSSPALQIGEKVVGIGYDPGRGYRWGDFGDGSGLLGRIAKTAPIPPIITSTMRDGFDPIRTGANILGISNYEEGEYQKQDRWVKENQGLFTGDLVQPGKTGDKYENLSPKGKELVAKNLGKMDPFGPEGKDSAKVLEEITGFQKSSDDKRDSGEMTPEQWRKDYQARKEELAIRNDQIYSKLNLQTKDPILAPYYAAIDAAKGKDGEIDWDAVDAYVAQHPEQAGYIAANTGLVKIDTPKTQEFKADYDAIKNSGYFQRTDKTWEAMADTFGIDNPDYYKWKDEQVAKTLEMMGATKEQPGKLALAESTVAKMPAVKFMEEKVSDWKKQWAVENPEEAYKAWKYGYYDPVKEIKTYLAAKFE